jgi:hypothetical protein
MDTDDAGLGLRREPVAVIRGAFLSAFIPLRSAVPFWDLAAASARFPRRIFWEPCPVDDGIILSSAHRRKFGEILAAVSPAARREFAVAIASRTDSKWVRRQDPESRKWLVSLEPAQENERQQVMRHIASHADERREEVEALFGLR